MVKQVITVIYQDQVNNQYIKQVELSQIDLIQKSKIKEYSSDWLVAVKIQPRLENRKLYTDILRYITKGRFKNSDHLASIVRQAIKGEFAIPEPRVIHQCYKKNVIPIPLAREIYRVIDPDYPKIKHIRRM